MNIVVASQKEEACQYAASLLAPFFNARNPVRIGLATGETMIPIYQALVQQLTAKGQHGVGEVETFNLDEYWPIDPSHPGSFRQYMHRHLLSLVGSWIRKSYFLRGNARDPDFECRRFEGLLGEHPLDVQLLGLGINGHIGFNEPGTLFQSRTRKVSLTSTTKERNARQFPGIMPDDALTMGIADIMEAKAIILVVFGSDKRDVLIRAILGQVSEDCPASILKTHPHVTVVADEAAGSVLARRSPRVNRSITVTIL